MKNVKIWAIKEKTWRYILQLINWVSWQLVSNMSEHKNIILETVFKNGYYILQYTVCTSVCQYLNNYDTAQMKVSCDCSDQLQLIDGI